MSVRTDDGIHWFDEAGKLVEVDGAEFFRRLGPHPSTVRPKAICSFSIPVRAPSTMNLREHFMVRAKRAESQKRAARASCPVWSSGPLLVVKLTRVSPRKLDDDNLRGALKSCRDGLATWLRIDDASPLVEWRYEQAKGEPCVRVEVAEAPDRGRDGAPAHRADDARERG